MKIKEIIRTNKGSCIENEKENDGKVITTVVISSLNYHSDDSNIKPTSRKKIGRNSAAAIDVNTAANDGDIVYLRNIKNNPYNVAFNNDYRYFGRTSMMDNASCLLSNKKCKCGNPNYNTKKNMMLNDFWERSHTKFKQASVQRYFINEQAVVNRLISDATNVGKCRSNRTTLNNDATSTVVANNNPGNVIINNNRCTLLPSTITDKGCGTVSRSQSLCLDSSVLLTDKRLVGLFRSVALYWFFCLNTVLAKGDHVFKRKAAVSPLDSDISETFLLQHNTRNCTDSLTTLQNNLQLQICCPDVVLVVAGVGHLNHDDFLWDFAAAENNVGSNLLTWAEHSIVTLFNDLFKKVLRDSANTCGIFKAIKPSNTKSVSSKRRMSEKNAEAQKTQPIKRNLKVVGAAEERQVFPPMSLKKTSRSSKQVIGVRRKYIIDYYDDDDEDDYGTKRGAGVHRTTTTVVNHIVWKKRAVKNKLKSRRKMSSVKEQQRVQQIIIKCNANAGDGYEEVSGTSDKIIAPSSPVAPVCPAAVSDDESFIDIDSYAENLKQEVAMRQLRKRKPHLPPAVIKIIEPSSSKHAATLPAKNNNTEDEFSGGTGSTSSSLLLELEEEESSYFLPDGRYHSATQKYPKYDLWCSPLVVEKVWSAAGLISGPASSENHTATDGRIFKPAKVAAPPAAAPSFKPYRLWESWWAPEDHIIPSFVAASRHRKSPKYASVVAMTAPTAAKATTVAQRSTLDKEPACDAVHQSMYTLWGSPNIIDCLSDIGVGSGGSSAGGSSNSVHRNGGSCSSSCGISSCSPEESSSIECDEYASPSDTFHILRTTAATINDQKHDTFMNHNQNHHSFNTRGGKFLNLKPIINGFVSFTDRGAFQYYRKPAVSPDTAEVPAITSLSLHSSKQSIDSDEKALEVSAAVVISDAVIDANDVEVMNMAMTTPTRSDYDTQFHFKPIQPAFKVPTDTPASFERSESGTLWYNKQKLMTFKHELDDASVLLHNQQRPRSRNSFHELDSFQPKFVVNGNDVGCQTEWFGLNESESAAVPILGTQTTSFFTPVNEKKNSPDPSYMSSEALFYAWDDVFNFLNKPALGNIDVKAHLDFSCFSNLVD